MGICSSQSSPESYLLNMQLVLLLAASLERCKLLDVQFVCKELYQHEPQQQGLQQQDVQQQELQQQGWQQGHQQQQQQPTLLHQQHDGLPTLEHERIWGDSTAVADPVQQQRPLCKRLSMRVVLQRLPAAPLCDEAADAQLDDTWAQADSSWQQRGLQGCGQVQQLAYTCTLEYPAFYIQVSVLSMSVLTQHVTETKSVCCVL
jgi:hypothetical protein